MGWVEEADKYFEDSDEAWERFLDNTPCCDECGRHVGRISDNYFNFDGTIICEDCVSKHKRDIDDFSE